MSYRAAVKTKGDENWTANGLRFATKEEADAYLVDLTGRWFAPIAWEAQESPDPVNYKFENGRAVPLPAHVEATLDAVGNHASDCPVWVSEPCTCSIGKR